MLSQCFIFSYISLFSGISWEFLKYFRFSYRTKFEYTFLCYFQFWNVIFGWLIFNKYIRQRSIFFSVFSSCFLFFTLRGYARVQHLLLPRKEISLNLSTDHVQSSNIVAFFVGPSLYCLLQGNIQKVYFQVNSCFNSWSFENTSTVACSKQLGHTNYYQNISFWTNHFVSFWCHDIMEVPTKSTYRRSSLQVPYTAQARIIVSVSDGHPREQFWGSRRARFTCCFSVFRMRARNCRIQWDPFRCVRSLRDVRAISLLCSLFVMVRFHIR